MAKWKRMAGLILTGILSASLLIGCGNSDNSKNDGSNTGNDSGNTAQNSDGDGAGEIPTFTIAYVNPADLASTDFLEEGLFARLEEEIGVNIEWQIYRASEWAEQKAAMLATGDLPDAFYGARCLTETEIETNKAYFVELTDLINENMPNLQRVFAEDPEMLYRAQNLDGEIYSLVKRLPMRPEAAYNPWINQQWLDNLGLKMPDTYEELAEVLKTFVTEDANKNGDPNDEIPIVFTQSLALDCNLLLSPFGTTVSRSGYMTALDENGDLIFMPIQDKFKEAVIWARDLYEAGCIDSEGFTMDYSMYIAKCHSEGASIAGLLFAWSPGATVGDWVDEYVPMPPVAGPDGERYIEHDPSFLNVANCEFEITTKCSDPAKLLQWADAQYTDQAGLENYFGYAPDYLKVNDDGSYEVILDTTGTGDKGTRDYGPKWVSPEAQEKVILPEGQGDKLKLDVDVYYKDYARDDYNCAPPVFKYSDEQTARLTVLKTDIIGYCQSQYAHWLTEGGIEEEWDAYLAQLDAMGLQEYMQIHLDAYAKYKEVTGK